jgi:hypothetical protein
VKFRAQRYLIGGRSATSTGIITLAPGPWIIKGGDLDITSNSIITAMGRTKLCSGNL